MNILTQIHPAIWIKARSRVRFPHGGLCFMSQTNFRHINIRPTNIMVCLGELLVSKISAVVRE